VEEEQRRVQIQIHKSRKGKGRERPQNQIPPHLPRRSHTIVFISRSMEVARARERVSRK
jgi:hypothetical protein